MPRKFSTAVLETLLKSVEVEFKVPLLGFGEIKFPVSEYAKEWWKNEKAREDLQNAIETAEQKFITQHKDNKAAQLLREFSLKNEEGFQRVIAELLNHLDEQKITWLMTNKLGKGFEKIVSNKELEDALSDYIPYLRDELSKIKEFREVIAYLLQKQIANKTSLTLETTQEIKDLLLKQRTSEIENRQIFTPEVLTNIGELPEPSDFLPPGSRMPFYRNKIFTGRESDLIDLAKILLSPTESSKNVVVTQIAAASGMGGIGKTQFAVEFCYRYGRYFYGIHWINANVGNLETEIAVCGGKMNLINFPNTTSEQVELTLREWQKQPLRLLILDNVEDPNVISQWLPRLNGLRILITSRRQQWSPDSGIHVHSLNLMQEHESITLLQKLAPGLSNNSATDLYLLVERLGNLPLALDLAGRYLNAHTRLQAKGYLESLDKVGNALSHTSLAGWFKDVNPTAHEASIAKTFILSWQQLGNGEIDKLAKVFFVAASFLSSNEAIPISFFYSLELGGNEIWFDYEKSTSRQSFEKSDDAILRLETLGLLGSNLSLHPLLAEFGLADTKANEILILAAKKMDKLSYTETIFKDPRRFIGIRHHLEAIIKHIEKSGIEDPDKRKYLQDILSNLGIFYGIVAEFQNAITTLEKALHLIATSPVINYSWLVVAKSNLASIYFNMGHIDTSYEVISDTKELINNHIGEKDRLLPTTYNNFGAIFLNMGKIEDAEEMFTKALDSETIVYDGKITPERPLLLANLANLYNIKGRYDDAIKLYESAIKITEHYFGHNSAGIPGILNNLSTLYWNNKEFKKAIELQEEALNISKNIFGDVHPNTATCLNNLAYCYAESGNPEKAYEYQAESLRIQSLFFSDEHPFINNAKYNLEVIKQKIQNKRSIK